MKSLRIRLLVLALPLLGGCPPDGPPVDQPKSSLEPWELALIVNDADPQSGWVAAQYGQIRKIPEQNVVHVRIPPGELRLNGSSLTVAGFRDLMAEVDAQVDPSIQAFALTWTTPYRVNDCMSITAAFAIGAYDESYCNPNPSTPCKTGTTPSPYFNSDSVQPYTDHGIRPTMMLAGETVDDVQRLIWQGWLSDATLPAGTAYLVRTSDSDRSSPRNFDFLLTQLVWDDPARLRVEYFNNSGADADPRNDHLRFKEDVFVYMTGLGNVQDIDTNTFVPGAVADHMTSFGGRLDATSGQMSILRWLEAGAVASYGTMAEPCAVKSKFPNSTVFVEHYFLGNTVIEAYWKSVERFGEGVFVGEPLARPFGTRLWDEGDALQLETTILRPGIAYEVRGFDGEENQWETLASDVIVYDPQRTVLSRPDRDPPYASYEILRLE